ncbi:hypothetical protein V6N11_073807 [Hibiscus sabdariffa]|uniref:GDP-L-galactose phosphorylase n=1 Tax=Hibiscus sabdariffa TaxID=183260 RepID=A0ABR2P4X9_9ROSI
MVEEENTQSNSGKCPLYFFHFHISVELLVLNPSEIYSEETTRATRFVQLDIVDITAIYKVSRSVFHVRAVRREGCVIESNPSPHGGRGALPSEGGSPSDLLFLAGGERSEVLAKMMQLSIKRVPTVVSNYQKDEAEETARPSSGCGKNCFRSCCIPGAKLPLYAFKKVNSIENEKDVLEIENKEPPIAFLDSLVLGEWEDRMQRGLFRYDVTACETKVISGEYGFIAQLNEGRHLKKRPTEFRVDKVLQPFDGNKFNFTKVGQEEVLFQFEASEDGDVQFCPKAPIDVENSPSVVAINVSPIEYGHVLLIPRILESLPQRIDHKSFLLALYMAAEAGNPYFRLGYNSLGAFATINHLHFQAYYLAVPFPIEKAPTKKIATLNDGVVISELLKYPVRGLVFEGGNTLQDLSDTVSVACICLQDNNIPYNVLISDRGKRIFLLPQCYAEKQALGEVNSELLDTQVNPAVWEISGHMVLKRRKDYDEASEENAWRLLAEVSLSDERFQEVNALIFEAIGGGNDGIENVAEVEEPDTKAQSLEEENAITESSHHAMVAGTQECLVLQ